MVAAAVATLGGVLAQSADAKVRPKAHGAQAEVLPAATIAARQHFFGIDNVDPATGAVRKDRVLMSWAGVATFAASFNGHVVMLDTWIPRGPSTTWNHSLQYVGTTPDEVKALKPEAYFIGHMHGDHAGDSPGLIVANPDMPVYGDQSHCDDLKAEVKTLDPTVTFNCFAVFPPVQVVNGRPVPESFGMVDRLPANTLPGVSITAVMHPHSLRPTDPVADPPFDTMQATKRPCVAFTQYPPDPNDPPSFGSPASGIIEIAWQFRIGDFSLVWADSNGPDVGGRDAQAWASVPPTDVLFGAIAVSGRSVLNEGLSQIRPKIFAPIHHDPCANDVYKEVRDQLATIPASSRPRLLYLSDPADYLKPIAFDPSAKAWKQDGPSGQSARTEAPSTATMQLADAAPAAAPQSASSAPSAASAPAKSTKPAVTKLTVAIAKAKGSKLSLRIRGMKSAGKLKAALTRNHVSLGSASRTLKRASTVTLKVKLSTHARRLLAAHRSLKASLKLTYTATGADALRVSRNVTIRR
ncbi:MAG TPA: MBL fold metallo-hydrolase [Solirubrobacter sp.]|nr:MBL fold metallo-hydrolase [Solirubrobacter sp.]